MDDPTCRQIKEDPISQHAQLNEKLSNISCRRHPLCNTVQDEALLPCYKDWVLYYCATAGIENKVGDVSRGLDFV